jgi:Tfp pilus assembly protein PilO
MQLPKSYFQNLSAARYKDYLKLLPNMQEESSRLFITLALTFGALSFFGIFAINPTLTTIADLKKQLADDTMVDQQLGTKLERLSALNQQYDQLGPNLERILRAVPQNADVPLMSAQIAALGKKHNLTLTTYRVAQVQIAGAQKNTKVQSFIFTVQAEGSYPNMIAFASELGNLQRIITVESMEIARDEQSRSGGLLLTIRGRQYFKQ